MLDGEVQCMWLIEGVLLRISPGEKDLVVNPYFKRELTM